MARSWHQEELGYQTLTEALDLCCNVQELRHRARLFEGNTPTRKGDLLAYLTGQLKGEGLKHLWERLDDLSGKAVAEALYDSSEPLDRALFRAKYGVEPPVWHHSSMGYGVRVKEPPSPLSMLIFGSGWIPDDLRKRLEALAPEPETSQLATVSALPSHPPGVADTSSSEDDGQLIQENTALAALHDVRALLALVDGGKVKVGAKTGQVSLAGAKAILPVLRNGDFLIENVADLRDAKSTIRPFAWPLLLQAAKLAEVAGSKLRLTRAGKKALTEPSHELIHKLWSRWLKSTLLDEFRRISEVKGQTKRGVMTAIAGRRGAVALALQAATPGQWIGIDEFMRYVVSSGHAFQVANNDWSLYLCDAHYGNLGYDGFARWLPKWYAMVFLWEYAATLGLIDIAFTEPERGHADYTGNWGGDFLSCLCAHDGLYYFRINRLGAWVLGLVPEFIPPEEEARALLHVLPNFEVTAIGQNLNPADRLFLERFAGRKNERTWSLELPRLLQAVEEGLPRSQIRAFLEATSADPDLPETVSKLFEDAASRVGRIVDRGMARVYACDDATLAKLAVSDTRLRKLCYLADERLLVVPSDSDKAFRQALRQLGYVAPSAMAEA